MIVVKVKVRKERLCWICHAPIKERRLIFPEEMVLKEIYVKATRGKQVERVFSMVKIITEWCPNQM